MSKKETKQSAQIAIISIFILIFVLHFNWGILARPFQKHTAKVLAEHEDSLREDIENECFDTCLKIDDKIVDHCACYSICDFEDWNNNMPPNCLFIQSIDNGK